MRQCKRTDGRRWRCRRPVMEGKEYCEAHFLQYCHRLKHEPVPASLKLAGIRRRKLQPKIEQKSSIELDGDYEAPVRRVRKRKEALTDIYEVSLPRKKGRPMKKGDIVEVSDEIEGGNLHLYKIKQEYDNSVVKDLLFGQMVITQPSPKSVKSETVKKEVSPKKKVGVSSGTKVPRRMIRSKNAESDPIATVQMLPSIKENIKASAKKNIIRSCHWCKYTSYRVLIQCSSCKNQFFCQECIDKRFHCKSAIKRECPVCQGTCECRACSRGKPKEVKTKVCTALEWDRD